MLNKFFEFRKKQKERKTLKSLRKAADYRFSCDQDLLTEQERQELQDLQLALREAEKDPSKRTQTLFRTAEEKLEQWNPIPGKSRRSLRNFLDVLAVAFGVAFGIRALYVQPFKIPTGSMQPTLFGIHYTDRKALEQYATPLSKKLFPLSEPRAFLQVRETGVLDREYATKTGWLFQETTRISIGGIPYDLPGNISQIARYLDTGKEEYTKGDVLCDGYLSTGDHVFVERLSLHFRGIRRGDVAVFITEGIESPTQPLGGYYFVKRIAGLPGDTLKIENRTVFVKPAGETSFRKITEFSDKFDKIYSFQGGYQGHSPDGLLADGAELTVPADHFFALGDNTSNSLDGRNWGFIPRKNMVGRALLVFWPVTRRIGLVDVQGPVHAEPTRLPQSMFLQ